MLAHSLIKFYATARREVGDFNGGGPCVLNERSVLDLNHETVPLAPSVAIDLVCIDIVYATIPSILRSQ